MSLITLITHQQPNFFGFEFDAVLEDTLEASVEYTSYPIESGASVTDHGIIQPMSWSITGIISDTPMTPLATDFTGALTNLIDDGRVAQLLGSLTGLASAESGTRASGALAKLIELLVERKSFDVFTGDYSLQNMVVVNVKRTNNPKNEGGLVFDAQLMELATLDTIESIGRTKQDALADGDPVKTRAAELLNKGEKVLRDVSKEVNDKVSELLL